MPEWMLVLTGGSLVYAGLVCWCLSQSRHQRQVFQTELGGRARWILRGTGALLLAFSLGHAVRHQGGMAGAATWCGLLMASALGLIFLLPYVPRLAVAVMVAGIAGSGVLFLIGAGGGP